MFDAAAINSSRSRRSSGSPPVKRMRRIPRSRTATVSTRTNSSVVNRSSDGSQSRPSAGMQ
ncbi:Uncharacterised protein [Mycobacteroides abscessus subsp. abscessus]|nr:Uncharacterised protein [Mycobacteroides abscessus subsp. abscessus]